MIYKNTYHTLSKNDTIALNPFQFLCVQEMSTNMSQRITFQISFSPNTLGVMSTDYFLVRAIGNISKTVVRCVGHSKGKNFHI